MPSSCVVCIYGMFEHEPGDQVSAGKSSRKKEYIVGLEGFVSYLTFILDEIGCH